MKTSNTITLKKENYFPSQFEFLSNKNNATIKCFAGGYGSGKTFTFLRACMINLIVKQNKEGKSNGLILYPTYSLAEEVFVEPFREILERNGIDYTYNIANHRFKTAYGNIKIYQTRHPQRIVGSSYTYVGIDELDIESYRYAEMAVQKSLGRLRGCEDAELFITTTPEGFGYTHHLMVELSSENKLLVHGKTTDNPYLPKSYIETLKENYDEQLLKAYIDGQFVNLTKGTYYGFNRDNAVKECSYNRSLPIRIGMDWNCDPLCWVLFQIYPDKSVKVFKEFALSHQGAGDLLTQRMCDTVKDSYPNNTYISYPDSTGSAKHSSAMYSDLDIVRANGYQLMVKHINPRVINRVNAMNNQFAKNNILIDPSCRLLIKDLEQVCNKEGSRDIDKSNKDLSHMSDALGYGIEWEYPTLRPKRIGVTDR